VHSVFDQFPFLTHGLRRGLANENPFTSEASQNY